MLFTLRILRFIFRLIINTVLFPIRLVGGIAGEKDSDRVPLESESDRTTQLDTHTEATTGAADMVGDNSASVLDVDTDGAQTNIRRFRTGLLAIGVLQFLFGIFSTFSLTTFSLIGVVLAIIPILSGAALPRFPTTAWYSGMGYIGLAVCVSTISVTKYIIGTFGLAVLTVIFPFEIVAYTFQLPVGTVTMLLYFTVVYFGHGGRDALTEVYGSGPAAVEEGQQNYSAISSEDEVPIANEIASQASTSGGREPPTLHSPDEPETRGVADDSSIATPNEVKSSTEEVAEVAQSSNSASTGELDEVDGAEATDNESADDTNEALETDVEPINDFEDDLTASSAAARQAAVEDLAERAKTGGAQNQAVVDALSDRLDDEDPNVRAAACDALGSLGASGAKQALKHVRIDSDREVSRAASRAIRNIK